jgi:glycosyltransferase involved in cell wall biosynthesis
MKILFVTDLHHLPQHSGGTQSLIHELALELVSRGHQPSVLAPLSPEGLLGLTARARTRLFGGPVFTDRLMGYPVHRLWQPPGRSLADAVADLRADVAVVMPRASVTMARDVARAGVPTVVYFQDVEFQQLGGDPRALQAEFVSNSRFTAERIRQAFGLETKVIPPLIRAERYRTWTSRSNVTMINPHPLKGGDLACSIAEACPDIPFSFVSCWVLPAPMRQRLEARLRNLPNVTLRPSASDMRQVYGWTKILLAPSRWEEAWGRVASEAHLNGIPVVASRRGGLPESVGPGGVLIDPHAPLEAWVSAVRRLWDDDAWYEEKSAAALAYSLRPELAPERIADELIEVLRRAARPAPKVRSAPRRLAASIH